MRDNALSFVWTGGAGKEGGWMDVECDTTCWRDENGEASLRDDEWHCVPLARTRIWLVGGAENIGSEEFWFGEDKDIE